MDQKYIDDITLHRTRIEKKVRDIIPDCGIETEDNLATKLGKLNSHFTRFEENASRAFLHVANELVHGRDPINNKTQAETFENNYLILDNALDRIMGSTSPNNFSNESASPGNSESFAPNDSSIHSDNRIFSRFFNICVGIIVILFFLYMIKTKPDYNKEKDPTTFQEGFQQWRNTYFPPNGTSGQQSGPVTFPNPEQRPKEGTAHFSPPQPGKQQQDNTETTHTPAQGKSQAFEAGDFKVKQCGANLFSVWTTSPTPRPPHQKVDWLEPGRIIKQYQLSNYGCASGYSRIRYRKANGSVDDAFIRLADICDARENL